MDNKLINVEMVLLSSFTEFTRQLEIKFSRWRRDGSAWFFELCHLSVSHSHVTYSSSQILSSNRMPQNVYSQC